jgi:outer membrane protein insertion porin family
MKFELPVHLVILFVLLSVFPAHATGEGEFFGKVIRKVEIVDTETNRPLDRALYDRSLALAEGRDVLTRPRLKTIMQALYDTGSFSELSAAAAAEGDGVRLTFLVRSSAYFNRFFLSPGVDLGGRAPADAIGLPVGDRFSLTSLEESRLAVVRYMEEKGFYEARVNARWQREGSSPRIDTTFDVVPGSQATIRSLTIRGVPENEARVIRERLGVKPGTRYRRDRFRRSLENLKKRLVDRGFLDAELELKGDDRPSYRTSDHTIALALTIANFGQVRIAVEGMKIPKDELRRLLPVLTGQGLRPELVEEGTANLKSYLEERGFPEASVQTPAQPEFDAAGARMLRYTIDRGRRVLVNRIQFRGQKALTEEEMLRTLQMQPVRGWQKLVYRLTRREMLLQRSTYSVPKLDGDVDALVSLYQSAGYPHAVVIPLVIFHDNGESVDLMFDCREGNQALVESVAINGQPPVDVLMAALHVDKAAAHAMAARFRLQQGKPYSSALTKHDRQILLAAFNDAGYLRAAVLPREASDLNDRVRIDFRIEAGEPTTIDHIVIVGRARTRESVIEKRVRLKPEQPLSLGKMLETQQALYDTGVFDRVRVEPQDPTSAAPVQNVVIRLEEARPRTLRYGLGYQEREKVRGTLELSDLNIFGLGQGLDLRLRGSIVEQSAVLSFKQPQLRFLPVDSYLTFSGSKIEQISFTERRLDMSYQYSHQVNSHTWGMVRYSLTNVRVSEVPPDLAREEMPRNLSTLSAYYVNDTRDNYTNPNARYLDPQKGFFTSTNLGITLNHGGGGYYASLYTQNSYYRRLRAGVLSASSFRFGLLYPIGGDLSVPARLRVPISERFFGGGSSTLRGFATDRAGPLGQGNEPIGGNALLIGNQELSVPVMRRFEIAGFYDVGNVFTGIRAIRWSDVSHTVGVGLRIKTPFGPVRLNYGINLNLSAQLRSFGYKAGHFFLTIGPPF